MVLNIGFLSLGCSKNLCDSENMLGILAEKGYGIVADPAEADVIVVNTCGFIDSAKQESIDALLEMAEYKKGRCRLLVAAGCMAQRYPDDIRRELPEVDVIIGTTVFDRIAEAIENGLKGKEETLISSIDADVPEGLPRVRTTAPHTAFLKIAEGCSNHCTYCAIPNIRGKYRSRTIEDILSEAETLAADGVKELIVIAQDTTRYGEDLYGEKRLPELLRRLCEIGGVEWVRVHYSYPEAVTDELIQTVKSEPKIVKYFDIPVQHGDNNVLKRMGRNTSREQISALVRRLREEIPTVTLRTSLIAGFPGETEEEFEGLLSLIRELKFDRAGVFAYSQEEGTAAARLPGQISEEEKELRRDKAMELAQSISRERNEKTVGSRLRVLVEGFDGNLWFGRSGGESPEVDPKIYFGTEDEVNIGDFIEVEIVDFDEYDLYGKQVEEEKQ
ncbi:MAG: 30S ribosomal protein S12 methylthiotransferase RimO [Oscillospiraceae bacterium]|nr:30S ribosomal protein S12 methylthiotransferase RimO [Oscillospiraceae bacterium]